MIFINQPHGSNDEPKNLGKAYNAFMERLRPGDWALFMDYDAMLTTRVAMDQCYALIKEHPDSGIITARANRAGTWWQEFDGGGKENHDIIYHRRVGKRVALDMGIEVLDKTHAHPLSGFFMLTSFESWRAAGGFSEGWFGVDNDYHSRISRKASRKVLLALGIYVYHFYHADGDDAHVEPIPNGWRLPPT